MKKLFFILILCSSIIIAGCSSSGSPEEKLAKCLTRKGAIFYGTQRCDHCNTQKAMFGTATQYLDFIDCDAKASTCDSAKIEGYPTWVLKDGTRLDGVQELASLAKLTTCSYP